MMSALDTQTFPRGALIAASALIGFSLITTTVVRLTRLYSPSAPIAASAEAPSRSITVRFTDEADGSVSVRDGRTNALVTSLPPGSDGFIRSVMRGLVHDRKRRGIGPEQPFLVSQWRDGRLTLEDGTTGRLIDLNAFGDTNRDAFARLLPGPGVHS
jgi:putative photosynthetic complex assembly protein